MSEHLKYVVCVTDNEASRAVLHYACMLAKTNGAVVDVLHVLHPADFQSLHLVADIMLQERRDEAEKMLTALTAAVHGTTGVTTSIHIRDGHIGEEILAALRDDAQVTLLLIGSQPAEKNSGSLISWLANQPVERLAVPLLVVPGRLHPLRLARPA